MTAIVDHPRREAAPPIAAAWLAFMIGLLAGGEIDDAVSFAFGGVIGAALVLLGFAAASRCRSLPRSANRHRARLALLSLAAGTGLGFANLAANWAIAAAHPTLRSLLARRLTNLDPLVGIVVAPIVEEVAVRLFLMSAIAWIVSRFTTRTELAFAIALAGSALVFALLHLARPMPDGGMLANYYRAALVAKYTLAGMALGSLFWRWGLPYAILCHAAANAAHLAFQDTLF
jgi:membrane protease YdiL (CAAX protease family)